MGALEVASLATQSTAIVQRNERRLTALRESTKIEREAFTDAIKAFCAYVDRTGKKSENPERAYSNFTRQVYAAFGLNKKQIEARMNDEQYLRAHFDAMELLFVQSAERSAAHAFIIGMEQNLTREDVKAGVKDAITKVRETFGYVAEGKMFKKRAGQ